MYLYKDQIELTTQHGGFLKVILLDQHHTLLSINTRILLLL